MIFRRKAAINYLSNNELLYEINKSKITYCQFIDPKYANYSVIIRDLSEIDDELIEQGKIAKATQYNAALSRKYTLDKIPGAVAAELFKKEHKTSDDFTKEDVVIRLMSFEHIPAEVQTEKKTLLNRIHFPPFKHYAYIDDVLTEVGRSHWKAPKGSVDLSEGSYSADHGKPSNQLIKSIMKLVDRLSSKGNFCNYSYLEDMKGQALLQLSVVSLQFDESKSNNPFAWYTATAKTSFIKVLKNEKKVRNIRDELMMTAGYAASFGHQLEHENDGD